MLVKRVVLLTFAVFCQEGINFAESTSVSPPSVPSTISKVDPKIREQWDEQGINQIPFPELPKPPHREITPEWINSMLGPGTPPKDLHRVQSEPGGPKSIWKGVPNPILRSSTFSAFRFSKAFTSTAAAAFSRLARAVSTPPSSKSKPKKITASQPANYSPPKI